jgi:TolA-binding protein
MRTPLIAALLLAGAVTPAAAQRREATPEQRIERLEKQVRQVQGRLFPKGQPVDTAGFVDEPAATQTSVTTLITRLDAVERQLAEMTRSSEENGNRIAVMEADLARLRADQERRLRAIETAPAAGRPGGPGDTDETAKAATATSDDATTSAAPGAVTEGSRPDPAGDPVLVPETGPEAGAEQAYDRGFQLWTGKKYDAAITALDAMVKDYPNHRRVSWANNLAGRALLDKGQPRAAAERLLANYRRDPKGERAQDSLFYLGQALIKLGQPGQACKAYSELEAIYGPSVRTPLRKDLVGAKAAAKCG